MGSKQAKYPRLGVLLNTAFVNILDRNLDFSITEHKSKTTKPEQTKPLRPLYGIVKPSLDNSSISVQIKKSEQRSLYGNFSTVISKV